MADQASVDQARIDEARSVYVQARDNLTLWVVAACPGVHVPTQHRDRQPPWCPRCGRDRLGVMRRHV